MFACAAVLATDRLYPAVQAGCAGMREVELYRMRLHKFFIFFFFFILHQINLNVAFAC